jgi:hypothetical protein
MEGNGRGLISDTIGAFSWRGSEKSPKEFFITVGVPGEIRIEHHQNASQKFIDLTSLLG